MASRVDFERYLNACARARNLVLLPQGGFAKRAGSRYITGIKTQSLVGQLIPFRFSATDAYIIELGNLFARFCRYQAQLTVADTDAAISNGTFTSNITGWDDQSTGSGAIAHDSTNGRLQLTGAANSISWAEQDVTTTATGVEHVLRFKSEGALGASVWVQIGSNTTGAELFAETELGMGWHTIQFTPSSSPFYVQFKNKNDPAETIYIDDVDLLDNTPLEIVTDYTTAQLPDIRTVQTADVLYLFHPDKPPRKFERRGDKTWSLVTVPWEDGPYNEPNEGLDISRLQLIKNPDFEDGIRNWSDESSSDAGIEYDGAQKIAILTPGDSASEPAIIEQQVSTGAAASSAFVLHFQILGSSRATNKTNLQIGTSSGGTQVMAAAPYEQGWHSIKISSSAATWYVRFTLASDADVLYTSALGGVFLYRANSRLLELSGTTGSVTCTALGSFTPFTSTDVGRIIRLSWPGKEAAWGVITAFTDTQNVTLQLRRDAPYSSVPTENWQFGSWSETNGYPQVAGFFQSRLIAANTDTMPQTLWFSQSADIENMRPDSFESLTLQTQDDDALVYTIAAAQIDPIAWIAGERKLLIGTGGGQWVAESSGVTITATDIQISRHSPEFCKQASPVASDEAIIFIEASGRKIFDLGFRYEQETFLSADITVLADHILKSAAQEIAYQRRPFSLIWTRRADGRLASLAYGRRQDVIGWSQTILGGSFGSGDPVVESIAIIPGNDDSGQVMSSDERDEVWMIVKRTVDGNTVRYIEMFERYYGVVDGELREDYSTEALWETAVKTDMEDAFYVDSGITYDSSATATITGLDHLEGESVVALADGRVVTGLTVASGSVTLPFSASKVHAGLPFTWQFETLKLAYGTQSGSALTKTKAITGIGLSLMEAGPFKYACVTYDEADGRRVHELSEHSFLRDGLALDDPVPLFTGELVKKPEGVSATDARIYLEGSAPLPFTCLAIAPQMSAGER